MLLRLSKVSAIYYAPIDVDVFECGMWENSDYSLVVNDSSLSVLIQSNYYWLFLYPSKSKRRDV